MVSLGNNRTMSFSNDPEPYGDHEHDETDLINHNHATNTSDTSRLLSGSGTGTTMTDDTGGTGISIQITNPSNNLSENPGHGQSEVSDYNFHTVDTTSIGIFQIFSSIGLFILSTFMPIECGGGTGGNDSGKVEPCHVNSFSFILYAHGLFWGLSLISDQYIQYQHLKVRRRGYLEFYSETRFICQLPIWIVSAWSTLLLTVSTILHDHCESNTKCGALIQLSKSDYITFCIGFEAVILIPVLVIYVSQVWKFNSAKSLPDVLRDDSMNRTLDFGPNSLAPLDEELFQRQAELIQYYKNTNNMLRRTVLELKSGAGLSTRTPMSTERPSNNF